MTAENSSLLKEPRTRPQRPSALEWRDRVFWEMSRQYPVRPMVCGLYLELDRAPSLPHLQARLSALLDVFPRLRQRIITVPGTNPCWEEARELRLDQQLVTGTLPDGQQHIALVARLASRMRERLDPGLPPWQLCVWSGATCHGLWLRWHHALSDGEGMLQLLGALADSEVDVDPPPTASRDLRRLSPALRGEFKSHARGSARMRAPALLWKLARQRQVGSRVLGSDDFRMIPILEQLDAAALSRLRSRWSVSTNELLVGLATGALDRCERRLGRSLPSLRVLSPISDRDQYTDVQLGNFSRALRPTIELGESVPTMAELMARVRSATREQIEHGQAAPYGVYRLVFALPGATRDRVLGKVARHIVNYMPWAAEPQWIAGARVDRLHGFTPMLPFHGCTFACSSYLGNLHANLVYDAALLEHPELLVECLHEVLDDALRDA